MYRVVQGSCVAGPGGALLVYMNRNFANRAKAAEPVTLLKRIPMFAKLNPDKLDRVAVGMVPRTFSYMDCVVREGEQSLSVFFVKCGILRLEQCVAVEEREGASGR